MMTQFASAQSLLSNLQLALPLPCRTLLLAGVAAALIFGGLALKQLNDSRAKKTFTAVDPQSMHDHGPDEPRGESCSKDHHQHEDHPLNIMVSVLTSFIWHAWRAASATLSRSDHRRSFTTRRAAAPRLRRMQ